jgi:hypothetical protein
MQLRAQLSLAVRKREPTQLRAVMVGDPRGWGRYLQLAWTILHNDLAIAAPTARQLIARSVQAAYECATRMNEKVQRTNEHERAGSVKQAFQRLSRCARRAPAQLRHLLDAKIAGLLEGGEVDLETIETLLQASREGFEQFPDSEAAATGLSALGVYREHGYDTIGLSIDFSSLSPLLQANCTSTLSRAVQSGPTAGAVTVFEVLARAISPPANAPRGAADIMIDYVAAVAAAWHSAGLRAGRALRVRDASYTSKFHRFCDLVLSALVEPHSRRHGEGLDRLAAQAWARHRQLPREVQKFVRSGLPRRDTQWLVTAHCLREGLGRFKKSASRLHMTGP